MRSKLIHSLFAFFALPAISQIEPLLSCTSNEPGLYPPRAAVWVNPGSGAVVGQASGGAFNTADLHCNELPLNHLTCAGYWTKTGETAVLQTSPDNGGIRAALTFLNGRVVQLGCAESGSNDSF